MIRLTEDRIMYKIKYQKHDAGFAWEFKPTLLQRIFGYDPIFNFKLVENDIYAHKIQMYVVLIPKEAYYVSTMWGALVSKFIIIHNNSIEFLKQYEQIN
jgi:hypothetical protein